MADRKISELHADKPVVRTGGKVFSDHSMLELVRIPNGELQFLIWNGKSAKIAGQFARNGETFVPLRVHPTMLCSLQLPSNTAEYGVTPQVLVSRWNSCYLRRARLSP